MWLLAHLLSLAHGLLAAVVSIAAFYAIALVARPRACENPRSWPDMVIVPLTMYVGLCSVATTSRHIPVMYVTLLWGSALWVLLLARFRSLRAACRQFYKSPGTREWLAGFSILYALTYLLVRPPASEEFLTLPANGAVDLVTHARYAKELWTFGTVSVDSATVEHLNSRASAFVLAWHSVFFLGDPLNAAMPLLFMVAALFGT